MPLIHTLVLVTFPLIVVFAAMRDATRYVIPNWLSLLTAAAFWPAALTAGLAPHALELAAALGVAALAAGVAMFAFGWIGGGDAKLFAACGVWIGWAAIGHFLVLTTIAGGALAVALLWGRRLHDKLPASTPAWLRRLLTPGENVPYGVAIAVGALAVFPQSPIVLALAGAGRV